MRKIAGRSFPEKWSEINARFASGDNEVNLDISLFADLDDANDQTVNSDCTPIQVQEFMVKTSVALSYCTTMVAVMGGHLNQAQQNLDTMRANKIMALNSLPVEQKPKSQTALESALGNDPDFIAMKWFVEDLKTMQGWAENTFRRLQKDAERWRAVYYGAQTDRKLTPGVESPDDSGLVPGQIPGPIGRRA